MITFRHKGDFSKTEKYFKKITQAIYMGKLDKFGREGVAALASATPVETGKTAASWSYEITNQRGKVSITFKNSNIQNGVLIAVVLQYGHGTRDGGWVEGRDYINPAIQPIFDRMADDIWREVTR